MGTDAHARLLVPLEAKKVRNEWIKFKGYERAPKAALPGVWRLKEGGYLVRGRVRSEKTRKRLEVCHAVDTDDPRVAFQQLQQELRALQSGPVQMSSRMRFAEFAASVFEERVTGGEIRSASTRRSWRSILGHLLAPYPAGWGDVFLDAMTAADVFDWRRRCALLVSQESPCLGCAGIGAVERQGREERCRTCHGTKRHKYGPRTINQWFFKFQSITAAAKARKLIAEDPAEGLKPLPTDQSRTYTPEEPNSLTPGEAVAFLDACWRRYPQWYAMVVLGMVTGRRPSELRPLRKSGLSPDVVFLDDEMAKLYIRRSHSEGDEIMDGTKTGDDLEVALPGWLAHVLRWQITRLPEGPQTESELLFPAQDGGLLDEGCLYYRFEKLRRDVGLKKKITPRALRRSYQDLQRAVRTPDQITRSISGHITEDMQRHYSTISGAEQLESIERMGLLLRLPLPVRGMNRGMNEAAEQRGHNEHPADVRDPSGDRLLNGGG